MLLDLSSFKCGHDAPTYGIIDSIVSAAGTPYSALHDIDANKPGGSIKIRVKTYAHSLGLHRERLEDVAQAKQELGYRIERKRLELLAGQGAAARRAAGDRSRPSPGRSPRLSPRCRPTRAARAAKTEAEKASERIDALKNAGVVRLGIKRNDGDGIARL